MLENILSWKYRHIKQGSKNNDNIIIKLLIELKIHKHSLDELEQAKMISYQIASNN